MAYLSVLAKLDAERKRTFGAVATVTRLELAQFEKVEAVLAWLDAHEPKVVVFDAGVVHAEKLCRKVRSKRNLASVPIIAIVAEPTDALVERLYAQGADDVIPSALGASLLARLKALPDREQLSATTHGMAVVADKDHARCDVIGRVLMNAGYDVKFALDDVALRYYTQQNKPRLVVLSAELGDTRKFVDEAQKKQLEAAWVVMVSRRDVVKQAEALQGIERLTVVVNTTAPENVLFTSNELLRQGGPPSRAEERVLYGTMVAYKPAGGETEDVGFTYNISERGLYVRTLAPPEEAEVWLELRPPRGKRRVRLEGKVAWRRPYDPASGAPVPPGFGVWIQDGLGPSLALWKEHVEAFVRTTRRGPGAVARLLDQTLTDARASSPELDRPSESHIAAIPVSLPSVAMKLAAVEAPPVPREAPPVPREAPPVPHAPPAPPPEPLTLEEPPPSLGLETRRAPSVPEMPRVELPAVPRVPAELPAQEPRERAVPPLVAGPTAAAEAALPALPPPAQRRRTSPVIWVGLVVLLVAAAATAAVALQLGPFAQPRPTGFTTPASRPVATAPATLAAPPPNPSSAPSAVVAPSASSLPLAAPSASLAPSASSLPSASAAPSSLPPVDSAGAGNGAELNWDEGYLAVRSAASVDVYATGFKLGPTNRRNKSKCGLRFVRLGEKDPPRWLSKGRTVDVKCQAVTEIEIAPE